ncbi:MAG: hypothetical protein Q4F00_07310 [bacterium]|nr:hypothetical protein [bacterium]
MKHPNPPKNKQDITITGQAKDQRIPDIPLKIEENADEKGPDGNNKDAEELWLSAEGLADSVSECRQFQPVLSDFMQAYIRSSGHPAEKWLCAKLREHLPEKSQAEIEGIAEDITLALRTTSDKKQSLTAAIEAGRSKESWFASEAKNAALSLPSQETAQFLHNLNTAITNANAALYQNIVAQAGVVSPNSHLGSWNSEAQSGSWNELDWSEYHTKDLAISIGKQAIQAAVQSAVSGVGFDIAQRLWKGEEIEGRSVIETALKRGADAGVKSAAAAAIKVGVDKKIITCIPKDTPASALANIAYVGIENAKVMGQIATGELSVKEGLDKMEQTSVSALAGLACSAEGAAIGAAEGAKIGAALGTVFGPAGTAVGSFIGGTVAYMAGSSLGASVVKGAQKLQDGALKVVRTLGNGIKSAFSSVASGIKSCVSSFCSGISSFFGF